MRKTTEYKGVSWKTKNRKWQSQITVKGVRYECGHFDTELEAIRARDKKIMALGLPNSLLQIFKPMSNENPNPKSD